MNPTVSPFCGSNACVHVEETDTGVVLTSTLGADKGRVEYNRDEWTQFISDVHAGQYDQVSATV